MIHRRYADVGGVLEPVMTVAETLELARATELRQSLPALYDAAESPVLLVLASGDDRVGKEQALRQLPIDDGDVRWIDSGHLVPLEAPAQLAAIIDDFAHAVARRGRC